MPKKTKQKTTKNIPRKKAPQNKTLRKKTQHKKNNKTGMVHYNNADHPKHLKLDKFNMDCASQVFQLLKFTEMDMSGYLQQFTHSGLNYDVMKDILNEAYPNNNFKWEYLNTQVLGALNNYLQPNQGTVVFIDSSSIHPTYDIVWKNTNSYNSSFNQYDENTGRMYKKQEYKPISHYVALFRKNKKGPQENNYFVRDPQERTTAYPLRDFFKKWKGYGIYILTRDNNKELEPYKVTRDILYYNLFGTRNNSGHVQPTMTSSNLSTLYRSGTYYNNNNL
jgi:hypothetical protein